MAGVTQVEAAKQLGVGQAQVSRAERGERKYLKTCIRMIETFGNATVEGPLYRITPNEA